MVLAETEIQQGCAFHVQDGEVPAPVSVCRIRCGSIDVRPAIKQHPKREPAARSDPQGVFDASVRPVAAVLQSDRGLAGADADLSGTDEFPEERRPAVDIARGVLAFRSKA